MQTRRTPKKDLEDGATLDMVMDEVFKTLERHEPEDIRLEGIEVGLLQVVRPTEEWRAVEEERLAD
jgi:hypothetical protein